MAVGHSPRSWSITASDACEEAGVAPVIKVMIKTGNVKSRRRPAKPTRIVVEDNGPGIPPETIAGIIDYNVRVSSRETYISPTRGRQGNALKTILPMAYVLGGEGKGETWIEARGVKHRILFSVNQIKQEPIVENIQTRSRVTTGTRITMFWPVTDDECANSTSTEIRPAVGIHLGQPAPDVAISSSMARPFSSISHQSRLEQVPGL